VKEAAGRPGPAWRGTSWALRELVAWPEVSAALTVVPYFTRPGDDAFASPLLALGAEGGILASAHLCTAEFAALIATWRDGRAGPARALGHRLAGLPAALFTAPNPTVIKGVPHAQALIPSPAVRLPLLPVRPATVQAALRLLHPADGPGQGRHNGRPPLVGPGARRNRGAGLAAWN
jgi:Dihydrodipicolinate synthetase family